jgi:endonuclease-3
MLSAQTKDEVTHATLRLLVEEHDLSVETITKTPVEQLDEWIKRVGFHSKKAKYIKETTKILVDKHKGRVPSKYDELIALPGVGPKMAHLVLQEAFSRTEGVSVDTHVHRICNRLKWAKSQTPGQTADQVESWLPRDKWAEINHMLVGFGQTICKPIGPRCYECGVQKLCPFKEKTEKPSDSKRKLVDF